MQIGLQNFENHILSSMDKRAEYWIELADYDFATAKAMHKTGRFLYVGFMCHRSIEKSIKALIAKDCGDGDIPPKSHNLLKLSTEANLFAIMAPEQQEFLAFLNPLNIEARYPEYKKQLIAILTQEKCDEIIGKTEGLLCWIKNRL